MHRIEWTHRGESFAVVTDGSHEDALALFVNARANLAVEDVERQRGVLMEVGNALDSVREVVGKLVDG